MHDCPVAAGDAWLSAFLKPLLTSAQLNRGAVFVVFDEPSKTLTEKRLPTLVLGPAVRRGARSKTALTHYGLLRTIEDAWRLPHLGKAASATPIRGIWR